MTSTTLYRIAEPTCTHPSPCPCERLVLLSGEHEPPRHATVVKVFEEGR